MYKFKIKKGYKRINSNFQRRKKKRNHFYFIKNFLIFIFIIIIFGVIFFFILKYLFKQKEIKIAICTMAKHENLYVNEFVKYYEKLGINKIIFYDDNKNNTERIKDAVPITKRWKLRSLRI